MNLLSDIITYVRRIIKTPSGAVITDAMIIDYINRFWIMDVDARMQLFDFKTKYQFLTTPGWDKYNMPYYSIQLEPGPNGTTQPISYYPVYQGFFGPCFINGIETPFQTQREVFFNAWPNYTQTLIQAGTGDGSSGPYNLNLPYLPNIPNVINYPQSSGIVRGHVDVTGVIAYTNGGNVVIDPPIGAQDGSTIPLVPVTSVDSAVYFSSTGFDGTNVVVADSGQFIEENKNLGLLMEPGPAPFGNLPLPAGYGESDAITGITQASPAVITANNTFVPGILVLIQDVDGMTQLNGNTYTVLSATPTTVTLDVDSTNFDPYTPVSGTITSTVNTINYLTGTATNVFFPKPIPAGMPINASCYFYQQGIPRALLYYNNCITVRAPPNSQYVVELNAYLTPAAFLSTGQAIQFAYMSEYIARGAARKILSDTGDTEQFAFYEPLFKEQEILVWKRSQRQFTSTRTQTIYSRGLNNNYGGNNFGQGLN